MLSCPSPKSTKSRGRSDWDPSCFSPLCPTRDVKTRQHWQGSAEETGALELPFSRAPLELAPTRHDSRRSTRLRFHCYVSSPFPHARQVWDCEASQLLQEKSLSWSWTTLPAHQWITEHEISEQMPLLKGRATTPRDSSPAGFQEQPHF